MTIRFSQPCSIDGVRELLLDLTGPWVEPTVFAGHGTSFQRAAYEAGDDAYFEVESALTEWAKTIDTRAVLGHVLYLAESPIEGDLLTDLRRRRPDGWKCALSMVVDALHDAEPGLVEEVLAAPKFAALRRYLGDE